jgi:hypothetical protein
MQNRCFIILLAKSEKGEIAILDFPSGSKPRINMILQDKGGNEWKIIGVSMPVHLDLIPTKIKSFYTSGFIWECLLCPIKKEAHLNVNEFLEYD